MTQEQFKTMFDLFQALGKSAVTLNHYDLAEQTGYGTPILWKKFLIDPEISEYIKSESQIMKTSELNKLLANISGNKGQVGQAQLIGALQRLTDDAPVKEGPAFIYCYIPLNTDQKHAENITILDDDPFLRGE